MAILHSNKKNDQHNFTNKENYDTPLFGTKEMDLTLPKKTLAQASISPQVAYRLIADELMDEGNARLYLATFCQTFMEPEAIQLMTESLEKNAIDKSEYPQTTELENRCVSIIADLWHVQAGENYQGTSTVGSSEACMLGGMAMKFRWRTLAQQRGLDINKQKPNLIISAGYQVCWEKFCVYWDIEMRTIPLSPTQLSLDIELAMAAVDEYTIGIVGILGITYTGKFDDIATLNERVTAYNKVHEHQLVIHIDGASGGLYTPFVDPELMWDFRLENVVSINTSGHKYGLVYPGVGWIIWRDEHYLPDELVFSVSYLGGDLPTMAINFSHSASHLIGQYYNFLRFGYNGYRAIHERTRDVAQYLAQAMAETGLFDIYNDATNIPIVCWRMKAETEKRWDLYDLADRLLIHGWQIPAYPLPANLEDIIIQRMVIRSDLSMDMAELLVRDIHQAMKELDKAHYLVSGSQIKHTKPSGFTH